jgi:hypothetical protein
MRALKKTNKENSGYLAKALNTKTLAVEHDDVNHMFYIKLDNGMEVIPP